jgi:hypothetical protein
MSQTANEAFYITIGLLSVALIVYFNRHLLSRKAGGVSALEWVYYVTAVAALLVGWYFNIEYMTQYGREAGWAHWTRQLFVNPASASGGQDLLFANVVLYPIWTVIDGRRSGLKHNWLFFPMSAVTSYAFGLALYLALKERQLRWNANG